MPVSWCCRLIVYLTLLQVVKTMPPLFDYALCVCLIIFPFTKLRSHGSRLRGFVLGRKLVFVESDIV